MRVRWEWLVYWLLPSCADHEVMNEDGIACTLAGCSDGVWLNLGPREAYGSLEQLSLRVCFGDDCSENQISVGACVTPVTDASGQESCVPGVTTAGARPTTPFGPDPQTISVTVTDDSGKTWISTTQQVSTTPFHPNGPDCSPTCRVVRLTLTPE